MKIGLVVRKISTCIFPSTEALNNQGKSKLQRAIKTTNKQTNKMTKTKKRNNVSLMVKLNSILREQNVTFVNNLDLYIQPGAYQFNLLTAIKMGIH